MTVNTKTVREDAAPDYDLPRPLDSPPAAQFADGRSARPFFDFHHVLGEFSEATTRIYLSALFEVGLLLFLITVVVNALARLLIWRVARGTAVGSRAL